MEMATIFDEREILNTKWESPLMLTQWLHDNGFKRLNSGMFSVVYAKPNHKRIIKLSFAKDSGWATFAKWAMKQTANKYLPNIEWIKHYADGKFFVTIMERLRPFKFTDYRKIDDRVILAALYVYADLDINELKEIRDILANDFNIKSPTALVKRSKSHKFIWTLKRIRKIKGGNLNDLHSDNFMVRQSTGDIVITDPLSNGYTN